MRSSIPNSLIVQDRLLASYVPYAELMDRPGIHFEWDAEKARRNMYEHGVSFDEAATVFADMLSVTIVDPYHSQSELRFVDIGMSHTGRLLVVSYTERKDQIRIISARAATRAERTAYEEAK